MKQIDAVIAGTHVIPSFGRSLLTREQLEQFATVLVGSSVPMLRDHDIDQPVANVQVVSAEVRQAPDGEFQLHVTYEVADDVADEILQTGGFSVAFNAYFDERPGRAPVELLIDPRAVSETEFTAALEDLASAGLEPRPGYVIQLSEATVVSIVLDLASQIPAQMGWAIFTTAVISGLGALARRGRQTKFTFVFRREGDDVVAELDAPTEEAFVEGVRALVELNLETGGRFVRDRQRREWREAGLSQARGDSSRHRRGEREGH